MFTIQIDEGKHNLYEFNKEWLNVLHLGTKKSFSENQTIDFSEKPNSFFYIISGRIKLSYIEPNGIERAILYSKSGALLNIINILLKIKDYNKVFTCLEPTEIIMFSGTLLEDVTFIKSYPNLIVNIMKNIAAHTELHFQQLGNSSGTNTKTYLCRIFVEMSKNSQNPNMVSPKITQSELAMFLGVNVSTLTRILVQLKQDKIIEKFTKKELIISDLEKLYILAENDVDLIF